jgi:hypothetical protein
MKKLFIMMVAVVSLAACQTADKKATEKPLSEDEKQIALKDSSNYTTIQWLDSTFIDLGKVKKGSVKEVTYHFKNTGNKNLIISEVRAACGCTVPETPEKPFAPGEEGVIKAKFDTKSQPAGEHRKYVNVTANTSPSISELTFRVEVTE